MTITTSTGLGSGLDIGSLVSQLVTAERTPSDNRLNAVSTAAKAQLSAFGSLKAALGGVSTALAALTGDDSAFETRVAASAKPEVFGATASPGAAVGRYAIEVRQLATAHKVSTGAFASADTRVGTGTLHVAVGDHAFDVAIGSGDATLAGIRSAINAAAGNADVDAAIVHTDDGARLTLTSRRTGAAQAISVTATGGDGDLAALGAMSDVVPPQDAVLRIDGRTRTSASNVVADAIDGVSLNLVAAQPDSSFDLAVSRDATAPRRAVEKFVQSYNALVNVINAATRYDASTRKASVLTGDALVGGLSAALRSALGTAAGHGAPSLAEAGVTTQADGTLALDGARFDAAAASNGDGVARLFAPGGPAAAVAAAVGRYADDGGILADRTDAISRRLTDVDRQRTALDARMNAMESRYRTQFAALDALIGQMRTTSSFLTQQLAALPGAG